MRGTTSTEDDTLADRLVGKKEGERGATRKRDDTLTDLTWTATESFGNGGERGEGEGGRERNRAPKPDILPLKARRSEGEPSSLSEGSRGKERYKDRDRDRHEDGDEERRRCLPIFESEFSTGTPDKLSASDHKWTPHGVPPVGERESAKTQKRILPH